MRPLYWLAGKIFAIWARPVIQPEAPAELIDNPDAAVCYVLETGGLADMLALERACMRRMTTMRCASCLPQHLNDSLGDGMSWRLQARSRASMSARPPVSRT